MKKGEVTTSQLKAIIFMVASLVILIALVAMFGLKLEQTADETTCRASVRAQADSHWKNIDFSAEDLSCPTDYPIISETDEEDIKYAIAEEMKDCWDDFGRGELELFDDSEVFCSVCSVMGFKKKNVVINDFTEWLAKTDVPDLARDGKYIKYSDYFANFESTVVGDLFDKAQEDAIKNNRGPLSANIDTSGLYSVVFVYIKGKSKISDYKKMTGSRMDGALIAGGGVGIAAGGVTVAALSLIPGVNLGVWSIMILGSGAGLTTGGITSWLTFFAAEEPDVVSMVLLKKHSDEDFLDLACSRFPSVQQDGKS